MMEPNLYKYKSDQYVLKVYFYLVQLKSVEYNPDLENKYYEERN